MPDLSPEVRIEPVESGKELIRLWRRWDYKVPEGKAGLAEWAEVVDEGEWDFLVARMGVVALGFIGIKWNGPVSFEPLFTEALFDAFPDEQPTAVGYKLYTHLPYRRHGYGNLLIGAAEDHVRRRPGVVPRLALNAETDSSATRTSSIRKYHILPYRDQIRVKLGQPTESEPGVFLPSEKESFLFFKDLINWRLLEKRGLAERVKAGEQETYTVRYEHIKRACELSGTLPLARNIHGSLARHLDDFHGEAAMASHEACSCPLTGIHIKGRGAIFSAKSILALERLLVSQPKALRAKRIGAVGVSNVTSYVAAIKELGAEAVE